MQFVDRFTDTSRIDGDIQPLIEAIIHNRQIYDPEQDDPPFVTQAVKYHRERQQRRETSPYDGSDPFVKEIIDLFDFDPLDFQVESWQTVAELDELRTEKGESMAAVFSAPTGFGKTEAFLGPLYQLLREGKQESTAIVYPSKALLQDQLGRVLEHVHQINSNSEDQLSVGVYTGDTGWEMSKVETNSSFFERSGGRPRFKLANCWCGDNQSPHSFEYHGTSQGYTLRCENDPSHAFTDREMMLARQEIIFNNNPDILLTTLESLESFALKPHYSLIDNIETIVLDEVHLNTQVRGAHAAQIIKSINEVTDQPLLWLGSSATIDNPGRFGKRLFGVSSSNIRTVAPKQPDFDEDHDDYEHYYFMLAPPDGPGVAAMGIQQHLLFGHSLLERSNGDRGKILAFIDSISQVEQKYTQHVDADHNRELWRYHLGTDDIENWLKLAEAMDHRFLDEHLRFLPVFSERGFDSSDASNSDVLLSTSFLEVGIDVGQIKIITQYRTPWDLSSFKQRAGRAARKEGMDSHIAVMLSGLTSDANMFYRADRFLDSEIRTPLKTDNSVVEWIHTRFREYYQVASDVNSRNFRLEEPEEIFLEEYLTDKLGYNRYRELILSPDEFFQREFGITVSSEALLSEELVSEVEGKLDSYAESLHSDFEEIESFFGLDDGNVVRGGDAVETYVQKVQQSVLQLINAFSGQVTGYSNELERLGEQRMDGEVAELEAELATLRETASRIPDGAGSMKVQHFEGLLGDLFGLSGDLIKLQSRVNQRSDSTIPQVATDRLTKVQNAVNRLNTLSDDNRIKEYYETQKQIYYLQQTLEELGGDGYNGYGNPYLSLYAIKHLLRGAYYLNQFFNTSGRSLGEVWYVPPNYYGDAGRFFTVFNPDTNSTTDESIDKLVRTYTPYRSEYQSESQSMSAFLPRTRVTDDGVEFDYSQHVSGEVRDGVRVPDSIELSSVADLSGTSADNIVRYCPECYQIISDLDNCLRHGKSALGNIHSDPQVSTQITDQETVDSTGSLALADVTSEVTLDGVTLNIRPASYWGGNVHFDGSDPIVTEIDSPDEPIGFQLDTRGLVFDMESYLERIDSDNVRSHVERYKDFEDIDYEYLAYHTAAHFFLQIVSDISAVNASMLFYGFDQDAEEVYVFERTEGGQGVVDLVYEELSRDPGSVLEAINRTAFNPQVINERLWAAKGFVDALPTDPSDEERIKSQVDAALNTPFTDVTDRVHQEVISSVDKAVQFARDEGIGVDAAYEIKRTIASSQVTGDDEFPEEAINNLGIELSDVERTKTVFYSPDIDGCVENLHLGECIAASDQSDSLSYVLLEALPAEITQVVPASETSTEMFDRELPPAGEYDDSSIFLNF